MEGLVVAYGLREVTAVPHRSEYWSTESRLTAILWLLIYHLLFCAYTS